MTAFTHTREVRIPAGGAQLDGTLSVPRGARGVVLFAHGSGSSRFSPRNRYVAGELQAAGFATLLLDLLTPAEEQVDEVTRRHRFDIPLLARRLVHAVDWLAGAADTRELPVGCFGASTGAAAALIAAADRPRQVRAVVSRGGRPDLAGPALQRVRAPTLLIVGGHDAPVIVMNQDAMRRMLNARAHLHIVPGATHLFEERGALEQVAALACGWFAKELAPALAGAPQAGRERGAA
jgi:dienelactone hydrolase